MGLYRLIKGFVPQPQVEKVIAETFKFKTTFYNQDNLENHSAYLSDIHPNRQSHAYATSMSYNGELPHIDMWNVRLEELVDLQRRVTEELGLTSQARTLFNVQEYFSASERVPKHHDGELLEFTILGNDLNIKRSIRPEQVAVLTLVNDTDGGGTRLYFPDGTEEVVVAEAGDLLIFDNINCKHGVDPLTGTVKREDGLLRLIIGWRSINENTHYNDNGALNTPTVRPITTAEAEEITLNWYHNEWPEQWAKIQKTQQKAAF